MSMEPHSSNQVENNPFLELSSESLNKLDEVLNSDSVKQLLSDSKSLENLAAAILDNEAPATSSPTPTTNTTTGNSAPGHVATVQEGLDLVDALDSLVNQLTNQSQIASASSSAVNQSYPRDNGPEVDYLGGNLEIGSTFDENWVDSIFLDHTYACVPVKQRGPPLRKDSGSDFSASSPNTPQRRSLRQIEKIEKSVLEKIKAENQEMLKREREEMGISKDITKTRLSFDDNSMAPTEDREEDEDEEGIDDSLIIDVDEAGKPVAKKRRAKKRRISNEGKVSTPSVPKKQEDELENVIAALSGESEKKEEKKTTGRSQRQRRKPKRWDDDEVEVDFSGTASELGLSLATPQPSMKRSLSKEFKKEQPDKDDGNTSESLRRESGADGGTGPADKKRKSEDSDDGENSDDWGSDDDPDKLWCICRQPHNNRFMICCDGCEDWFHGTCVGVTRKQGRICEEEKRKWFCAKCRQEDSKKTIEEKMPDSSSENREEKTPVKKTKLEEKKEDILKRIKKAEEARRKDSVDPKLKQKPRLPKPLMAVDKKEEEKLKKLIKSKKMEFKKKLMKGKDEKEKKTEWEPISKVVPVVKKPDDKKKKLKEQPIDLSFQDLFKAEPMTMKKSINSPSAASAMQSPNTPTTPKATNMQSPFRKPSFSGEQTPLSQPKKIAVLSNDQQCVACNKTFNKAGKVTVYCSEICIEKHVKDMLELLKQTRSSSPSVRGEKRIVAIEKSSGRLLAGGNAVAEDKILDFLKSHPSYEILKPNVIARRQSSESEGKKKEITPRSPTKKKEEAKKEEKKKEEKKKDEGPAKQKVPKPSQSPSDSGGGSDCKREGGSEMIRHNVKKALRDTLTARYNEVSDLKNISQDDIKKIASRIEEEMYNYFNKDTNGKYRTRYRSLVFNLKDVKNQGLFRKVLTGKIEPSRLVRMSPEELASSELAKWRERENKHMLEMIKRDAEQQAQQVIVKKTHKGEELIETKVKKAMEEESGDDSMEDREGKVKNDSHYDDVLQEDTTAKHGQHVFDVRCNICTKQIKKKAKNSKEEPKRVRVELDEPTNKILQEAAKLSKDVKSVSSSSSSRDSDQDQVPTSTTIGSSPEALTNQNKSVAVSCWKGIVYMQDVAKFVACGYKVSGTVESQDIPDYVQVCGRIAPEQVLDYLKKLKFSSRTEISVVRFSPASPEEKTDYNAFFTYLNTRKRYGVVGASKSLKDFYILPLSKDVDPPEVLLPFNGPGLPKRQNRQNLLLGILIKSKKVAERHPSSKHAKEKQEQKTSSTDSVPQPMERSYTPPPINIKNENSTTEEEPYDPGLSLTPPMKPSFASPQQEETPSSKDEEPYDPEDNTSLNDSNLCELLEKISRSTNPTEMTSTLLSKIANSATIEQQRQLLNELTNKVEESKKQLEEQRRAAEAAFTIATTSAASREKSCIPGLDGSFPNDESSLQLPGNIQIPDNLKEILETVQRKTQEQEKSKVFDDPIVKTYGEENMVDPDELKEDSQKKPEEPEVKNPEPMELDEENIKADTIIEVNNTKQSVDPRLRSKKQQPLSTEDKRVSQLRDDELMYKAQLQLKALKDMEMRQKNLEEARKQAADAINKAASSHLSSVSSSSVVMPSSSAPDDAKPKIQIQWKKKPLINKS